MSIRNRDEELILRFMDTQKLRAAFERRLCLWRIILIIEPCIIFAQSEPKSLAAHADKLEPIGQFDRYQDVGNPKLSGSTIYNKVNVPSWSPDSKTIAFISNSKL